MQCAAEQQVCSGYSCIEHGAGLHHTENLRSSSPGQMLAGENPVVLGCILRA